MNANILKTTIIRPFIGYLLAPEEMFGKEKENSVFSAFSFFISLFIISFLFYSIASLMVVDGVVPSDRQVQLVVTFIMLNSGLYLVEEIVLILSVHLVTRSFRKDAFFPDSLKIAFISSAYWVLTLNLTASLIVLLQSIIQEFPVSLLSLSPLPLLIPGILFVWIAANGIKVLHKTSGLTACSTATCSIVLALIAGYLSAGLVWDHVHHLLAVW